ncbi:hypothetical protein L596_017995 [Steinernema carpocapsae]|uniref:Uncharacterized protein n=1 Tax=Steinernema carpocapsae TaxID=34508 RepID=A0A4U5N439_STECR|nr:hypothetical protein L596_017995 [Steinernema carpocapsae]
MFRVIRQSPVRQATVAQLVAGGCSNSSLSPCRPAQASDNLGNSDTSVNTLSLTPTFESSVICATWVRVERLRLGSLLEGLCRNWLRVRFARTLLATLDSRDSVELGRGAAPAFSLLRGVTEFRSSDGMRIARLCFSPKS